MRNVYKIIIIDDDELAIENLATELKAYPCFSVEGIARNGVLGKNLIFKIMPDLIFLDVELPDMHGSDLLNLIRGDITWNMQIIFYTAYNKYMLDAIRGAAFDYLLKPIDKEELSVMLKRFAEKNVELQAQSVPSHIQMRGLASLEETIIIPSPTNDLQFIRPENIGFFKYNSDRKQWEVYLSNTPTSTILRKAITAEQILNSSSFFIQVHQSYIININYLVMVKDKKCVFYPPFDRVHDLQISKLFLKKLQERFLMF